MADLSITSLHAGTVFAGDYRVLGPLSQGGMGAVFVAEQLSTRKQRALKVMLPQLVADPDSRRRFEQEARVGAQIDSEHVVEVVGAGVDAATGMPWLAMELLRGEDLAHVVKRRGPLPPAEVLAVFEQLCHALGAAHAAGIIHRDLKPENLFLAEARRAGVAFTLKVLDFGIAKITQEAQTGQTAAMGSPMWMAPEQTERSPVTPATDVWALGLVAFYLLTATRFWRSAQTDEGTVMQLMREVLFEDIPAASVRAAEFGVRLPPSFDAWFARCLSRPARARFGDAAAAFVELRACLLDPYRHPSGAAPVASHVDPARPHVATVVQEPGWTGAPMTGPASPFRPVGGPTGRGPGPVAAYTPPTARGSTPVATTPQASGGTGRAVLVAVAALCALLVVGTGGWLLFLRSDAAREGTAATVSPAPTPPTPFASMAPSALADPGIAPASGDGLRPIGDAGLGLLGIGPSGPSPGVPSSPGRPPPAGPAAADRPRPPAAPNPHVGRWGCVETDDLSFTSPPGRPPYHGVQRGLATVVENADHTLTTTYSAGDNTCSWRERVEGATAVALPNQVCHTPNGGLIALVSAVRTVNGASATSQSTSRFQQYFQAFGRTVPVTGNGSATIVCTRL